MADETIAPRMQIRRFDVFAEYNRLRGIKHGLDEAHAKGYGLWVAKIVASGGGRRGGGKPPEPHVVHEGEAEHEAAPKQQEWHYLGDEPQTDELFDREVVRRMGADFYHHVFAPAIEAAFEQGRSYEGIRDAIRKDWKPRR